MGYGVWNPSLLEDSARALHVECLMHDDESDQDEREAIWQDEEYSMLAVVDSIAKHFDAEVFNQEGWFSHYGDRYQYLKSRFILDKAAVFFQPEPFMGWSMCFVVAPAYALDTNHPIWLYDDNVFFAEYRLSPDRYRRSAWRQAQHLEEMLIAALLKEGFEIRAGSGYMTSQVQANISFEQARSLLMKSLPAKLQNAIRHKRKVAKALTNEKDTCSSATIWF